MRAARSALSRLRRTGEQVGRVVARIAPLVLVAAAVALFVGQPIPDPINHDALIGIAGILATVLSIGFAVTLLVAQHTAERHARVLYVQFRRERAWLGVLGLLALGVVLVTAGALIRSTVSTGWASLALAVALGFYTASLVPRLFDSLDATLLADRLTDRTVADLRAIARRNRPYPDPAMKPATRRGLEIARLIATQGVASDDSEVVRAGFRGMRRVLVAYIEGSSTRGWDGEIVNLGFQSLRDVTDRSVKANPVLMLPAALEELTTFGVESQRTLEEGGNETVSGRLNSLFLEVVAQTLKNDQSAAPAMATAGIGDSAQALIRARSPNMVADHIRTLRTIALGSMGAERDHVAGVAHVQLSKIAVGLASMDTRDIMPSSLFGDACEALRDSVNAFVDRASKSGGLANDWAWNYVTMPHMETNLAWVVIAGVSADSRRHDRHRSDFGEGAVSVVQSLVKLGSEGTGGFSTPSDAIESAYMAVLGAMATEVETRRPDLIPEMWLAVARRLVDPDKEKAHEVEMLSGLLLAGAYEAESSRPSAPRMKEALSEALKLTTAIDDKFKRRRRARAWLGPGRAALGCGDEALADAIAKGIAVDLQEFRSIADGSPWRIRDSLYSELFMAGQSMPQPEIPDTHTKLEVIAAFDALLDKHQGRRRPRRRPPTPPEE